MGGENPSMLLTGPQTLAFSFHVSTSLEGRAHRISVAVLGPGLVHRVGEPGKENGDPYLGSTP